MITSDWHIHSTHSYDCGSQDRGVVIADLAARMAELGIQDFGITDHLHTPYNLDDIFRSHEDWKACAPHSRFHFGVEVSCISQWELEEIESGRQLAQLHGLREGGPTGGELALGLTEEDVQEYGLEYVIGAVHYPHYVEGPQEIIQDYQRQLLFLAAHPLVDIIAHPWAWVGAGSNLFANEQGRYLNDPWLDDFGKIPLSLHDEFAAAVKESGKAVEFSLKIALGHWKLPESFAKEYIEYLAYLAERGVTFAMGSDSHERDYGPDLKLAEDILRELGLDESRFWTLPPREETVASPTVDPEKPLSKYQKKLLKRQGAVEGND